MCVALMWLNFQVKTSLGILWCNALSKPMKNMIGMTKSAIQCEATFTLNVDVQNALDDQSEGPEENILSQWANLAYEKAKTLNVGLVDSGELDVTIRVVEAPEITQLNRDYRGKDKATNVLSFPWRSCAADSHLPIRR